MRVGQAPVGTCFWGPALRAITVTTCAILPVFLLGGLAVQIRTDFDLPVSAIGLFSAAYFASAAALSISAGKISERIGATAALRGAAILAAVALTVTSLAPSSPWVALGMMIGGSASSLAQVSSNLYLTTATDPTRQGLAFGIKQAAIPAATLLGGLSVPLVALTIGWRWAFAGAAGASVLVALSIPEAPSPDKIERRERQRPDTALKILVVIAVAGGLGSAAANSLGAYLVDSSVAAGTAPGTAGLIAALGSAFGLSTRIGMGWLADRATRGRLRWVAGLLIAGAVGFALLATRTGSLLLPATVLCFAGGWGWPGLLNFAVVLRNRVAPAAATGVTQTGVYVGGSLGPLLFGVVAGRVSYTAAWGAASVVGLLAAGSVMVARRMLLREAAAAAVD